MRAFFVIRFYSPSHQKDFLNNSKTPARNDT
jgi:hypothetical protein